MWFFKITIKKKSTEQEERVSHAKNSGSKIFTFWGRMFQIEVVVTVTQNLEMQLI